MKLRRVILNSVQGKSVVQKFKKSDMRTPLEEVVYAMPALSALTYYFMQFVIKDYAWEKYPKYIQGTVKSRKVCGVFYYDKLEDYVIRSSPYTREDKWRFHKKSKKSVLPERKKRLVLKKGKDYANTNRVFEGKSVKSTVGRRAITTVTACVGQSKMLRKGVLVKAEDFNSERSQYREIEERKQEAKMVVECSLRKVQRRTIRRL